MAEDYRTELIDQALTLFAGRGYDAVSVQEIVDGVGVTKPTLYHYFGSKRGLLDSLLKERLSPLLDAVREQAGFKGDLMMNLRGLAGTCFDFARRHPQVYQLLLSTQVAPRRSEVFRASAEYHEQLFSVVMNLFEQALPHMHGRHRGYAFTFIGMVNTYITLAFNGSLELDDDLMYRSVHQFMHGIFS